MTQKEKKIELFQSKLNDNPTSLDSIIYSDAISLLNNEVNPDKVQNWVNIVLNAFKNKPKSLTDNEKKKIEDKKQNKIEKANKLKTLNDKIKALFTEYGIYTIGFFGWKELSNSEYELIKKIVVDKGFYFDDWGNGAINLFISKEFLSENFKNRFNKIKDEIDELPIDKTILDSYWIMDVAEFSNKINQLI